MITEISRVGRALPRRGVADPSAHSAGNADLAAKVSADLGVDVSDQDFLPFPDLAQSVRDDVALLAASPVIADVPISGGIYDVKTGAITVIN